MSQNDAGKPIRAGRAFAETVKGNPKAEAALGRTQEQLRAFHAVVQSALRPIGGDPRRVTLLAIAETLRFSHEAQAAVLQAVQGEFDKLRALAKEHPDVKEAAEEVEQAIQALKAEDAAIDDCAKKFVERTKAGWEAFAEELRPLGFGVPHSVEDVKLLADSLGLPVDVVQRGDFTLSDVQRRAIAMAEQRRLFFWKHGLDEEGRPIAGGSAGVGGCGENRGDEWSRLSDGDYKTPKQLADVAGVKLSTLRSRLNRWRKAHDVGYKEIADARAREEKYLYQVGAVRSMIDDLRCREEERTRNEHQTNTEKKK